MGIGMATTGITIFQIGVSTAIVGTIPTLIAWKLFKLDFDDKSAPVILNPLLTVMVVGVLLICIGGVDWALFER